MGTYVAVTTSDFLEHPGSLKQAALLFDRVTVFELGSRLWGLERAGRRGDAAAAHLVVETEWLRDQGVLCDPDPAFSKGMGEVVELVQGLIAQGLPRDEEALARMAPSVPLDVIRQLLLREAPSYDGLFGIWSRMYALEYRRQTGEDAVSLLAGQGSAAPRGSGPRDQVASVVLKVLPVPDELTPWQEILDFRADPEARGRYNALRRWMGRMSSDAGARETHEVEEELLELLHEYEAQMRLHRMKVSTGVAETILTASGELLDGLLRFRWSRAATALFAVRRRRIELLEAERTSTGRELAYIIDSRKAFAPRARSP